ncbi:uncharacterized protein M421DRAFT_185682 [Didymella exigua CBS 183.55]|uniref:Aminoglycoside phosphotransferase domain-containing protein n=1 Tax=Didymella exigua CBS 183.55 TaxID=1150837 RepID=A0A6A5RNY8_9PLEO|nr:uncharacterized protein M421DRAFT_185682 [Didymella exigua CBS 183.55]KAF1927237.1 hypothetical protein M421DRAFT_185682 [Didymella exigua CBS 183.55]
MAMSEGDFWKRIGLQDTDRATCIEAITNVCDRHHVAEFEYQGFCSFTLLVSLLRHHEKTENEIHGSRNDATTEMAEQAIIQFRPPQHALDLDVSLEASRIYPSLAPKARALNIRLPGDLCAYELERLPGTPLSRLLPRQLLPGPGLQAKQKTLISSFARIVAQSWPNMASRKRRDSILRPDSPEMEGQAILSLCTGKVGSCIAQKLQKLAQGLPDERLREKAATTLQKILAMDIYPVVLNHGDLIPSNILVDERTWEITGLVDWAEAEYLPFGTCLYGLEHLLGFLQAPSQYLSRPIFLFYEDAAVFRELFWTTLSGLVSELGDRHDDVRTMRDLGILLWHGYAWDDGAVDRVVDEVADVEELAKLRAFLSM